MAQRRDAATSELVIMGGGLAGLSLALHCRQRIPQARVRVLEKSVFPVPEAAFKVGESTVEVGANYFVNVLGLRPHIEEQQLPKLGLRFFFGGGDNSAIERRFELGGKRFAPLRSYQLDRGRFENYLHEECLAKGVEVVDGARIQSIELARRSRPHEVQYECDGSSHVATGRWLVDASGRAGILKRHLGLQKSSPHKANAVWFRIQARIKIDDWAGDPAWRNGYDSEAARWYSTNHLMGEGYWVWLIPLASGSTSVGIVADEGTHPLHEFNSLPKALSWLDRFEPQCASVVRQHAERIQDFRAIKHYAHECQQVFSAQRWGITGEAGFFLDPFYSPGSDFIAFANTMLTDLIGRDINRAGGFRYRSFLYDRIFKKFYHGTAAIYQDQYPLFGNQQVMPVKILWDYLIYWSLTGFICLHGRECDVWMYPRHLLKLNKLGRLNHFLQEFFRQWHRRSAGAEVVGSVDISSIDLVRGANERLLEDLSNREFSQQFAANVAQLETLFWEIIDHAGLDVNVPFKRRHHPHARQHAFHDLFQATSPAAPAQDFESPRRDRQAVVST